MNDRIKSITDAAACLFLQQGYSKTQISHIAKAVGVSVGTIYLDFTGKKEIMHFVLKCTIDPAFIWKKILLPYLKKQEMILQNTLKITLLIMTLKPLCLTHLTCLQNMPSAVCLLRKINLILSF